MHFDSHEGKDRRKTQTQTLGVNEPSVTLFCCSQRKYLPYFCCVCIQENIRTIFRRVGVHKQQNQHVRRHQKQHLHERKHGAPDAGQVLRACADAESRLLPLL